MAPFFCFYKEYILHNAESLTGYMTLFELDLLFRKDIVEV